MGGTCKSQNPGCCGAKSAAKPKEKATPKKK